MEYLYALAPPIGVGLVFWFTIRSIIRADRKERMEQAAFDALEASKKESRP
ncbi:hypothetical protein JT358_01540 [Micrococcales bacterium 31B]|nr:hypothetical protein [Micrococcales bacterium 31B]